MVEIRHGDVHVQRLGGAVTDGWVGEPAPEAVLAYGEVTNHAHRVRRAPGATFDPELLTMAGAEFSILRLRDKAILSHEEHKDIALDPGVYRVSIKRQYAEDERGWSNVED